MADWLTGKIRSEAKRLLELAADDPQLRADLRELAHEILRSTADQEREAGEGSAADSVGSDSAEPLRELTLGQARHSRPARTTPAGSTPHHGVPDSNSEADALEAQCRAKGRSARWVAECRRRERDGADSISEDLPDPEMKRWAESLTNAFYFQSAPEPSAAPRVSLLDDVAGCYEAVAESLALAAETRGHGRAHEQALQFVAEAQSALRRALQRLDMNNDPDQEGVYEWLRATAARERVYIRRHMRADDLADPASWPSMLERIERNRGGGRRSPAESKWLEQIHQHQMMIRENRATAEDWTGIIAAVDGLVASGMPPSGRELRDLLLPILDDIPDRDDFPQGFTRVLREIDQYIASRPEPSAPAQETETESTAELVEVARLLRGRSIVMIGGSRRRDSQEALREAFGLKSVVWIDTKEHQPVQSFEPQIARADVALVLLAIRWSSHSFGEVRHICDAHGKPLVRLPGGYSPNQVAMQILTQSGKRLGRQVGDAPQVGPSVS